MLNVIIIVGDNCIGLILPTASIPHIGTQLQNSVACLVMMTLNEDRRFHKMDSFLIIYKAKGMLKRASQDASTRQFDTRMNTSNE